MSSIKSIPLPETFGLPPVGVETHAHLDFPDFAEDLEHVLDRARSAGVAWFGNIFLSTAAYRTHQPLFSSIRGMFFTLGIHPHEASTLTSETLVDMTGLFGEDPQLRALGEIGLDYYWHRSPRQVQIQAFQDQLALAKELDKPVVVHSREAEWETLDILKNMGFVGRPVLWHCFGQNRELAEQILSLGWHISIPGVVTFPRSTALRDAIPHIPLSRMVLETDSPFLTPQPYRGKRNEPAYLCYTAQSIADLQDRSVQEVWSACAETACAFFNLVDESVNQEERC